MRPELADLLPIAQRVLKESRLGHEQWSSLESHTEAAWVRRARNGSWPAAGYWTSAYHQLVCRPNLDLHTGTNGLYRRRHGNMRRDDAQAVLARALADGPISQEQLYFPAPMPPIADLASLAGDAHSMTIHFDAGSVLYRWLSSPAANMTAHGRQLSGPRRFVNTTDLSFGRKRPRGSAHDEFLRRLPDVGVLKRPRISESAIADSIQQSWRSELVR